MDDLTGTADQRARQLAELEATGSLSEEWLTRQLKLALKAWEADETLLDINAEGREDF